MKAGGWNQNCRTGLLRSADLTASAGNHNRPERLALHSGPAWKTFHAGRYPAGLGVHVWSARGDSCDPSVRKLEERLIKVDPRMWFILIIAPRRWKASPLQSEHPWASVHALYPPSHISLGELWTRQLTSVPSTPWCNASHSEHIQRHYLIRQAPMQRWLFITWRAPIRGLEQQ